ncbi:uncharacterized protein E0L32_004350 [Thyridium curvatum]|uniref:Nonselective cation channel n=1 Tax=Thyridium curvatum TaxID=1093900 RepID=A0A507B093_9PEZI|nr:uncharacterized protein E0L32_004350 [Thyridium curvatum]TPX15652.1 hypothetical protein E0L32_004350 [Thyridium curvatum]
MGDRNRAAAAHQNHHVHIAEPERRPLLERAYFSHQHDQEPVFSCFTNPHSHLPVYTNIHRIRRDIISIVEDYMTLEQLRDVRINISVVRPLVDKLYEMDDISIVYCLLVNRAQFLYEQSHLNNRQNVNFTRATLCELVAVRILRRFNEDNEGPEGLLVLAHILVAGFEPFQNAPESIRREAQLSNERLAYHRTLPALEVAVLSESKLFLSSTSCQKVVDAIYEGRVIYTPSSFLNVIPDRYKQKPISLYDPREGGLLNQYRLIVPRTRNFLEVCQFIILLLLYLAFMAERQVARVTVIEACFAIYACGWVLDQFATILEHGWHVYTQNLWSFLDVTFAIIYWIYLILRIQSWRAGSEELGQQALDVLAIGAPVLIPRLAFNLMSDNLLFVSLRAMMADFTVLTVLAGWCFAGFMLSLAWLGQGVHPLVTIGRWMIYIWFGLDGSGILRSAEFHWLLGPCLMVAFAFLGNTLFLTILVSMLSNTFSTIVQNATAEIQYRHAVLTLEGVKSDAIFAYQPPFNIVALLVLVPLKFIASPRWFHKIHVASVRAINLPLLLIIAVLERRLLPSHGGPAPNPADKQPPRLRQWFWEKWRITAHGDIQAVFELPPPEEVEDDIAVDDDLTRHLIRRQFTRRETEPNIPILKSVKTRNAAAAEQRGPSESTASGTPAGAPSAEGSRAPSRAEDRGGGGEGKSSTRHHTRTPSRRDSIAPYAGLAQQVRGVLRESEEMSDVGDRLTALEESNARIEALLARLLESGGDGDGEEAVSESVEDGEARLGMTGGLRDLDRSAQNQEE